MIELTILNLCLTLISILSIHFIISIFIKPYILVRFYSKQGITPSYFPIMGEYNVILNPKLNKGDPYGFLKHRVNKIESYKGSVMPFGSSVLLKLADPEYIKIYSQTQNENYSREFGVVDIFRLLGKHGMGVIDGDFHKRLRKTLSSSFLFDNLKNSVPMITQSIREHFNKLQNDGKLKNINIIEVHEEIMANALSLLFFGDNLSYIKVDNRIFIDIIREIGKAMMELTMDPLFLAFGKNIIKLRLLEKHRRFLNNISIVRSIIKEYIRKKKADFEQNKVDPKDHTLINAMFKDDYFTLEDIIDQYIVFYLAGIESTARVMNILLYHSIKNIDCFEKLQEEINQNVNNFDEIQYDTLNQMKFLNAMIKETLRATSPVQEIFPRLAKKDHKIGTLSVKKGTVIGVYLAANCQSEKNFKDFEKFDPTRWLEGGEATNLKDPFIFIPFFTGIRNCIGQHLSQIEIKLCMINIIKHYKIQLSNPNYDLKFKNIGFDVPVEEILMNFEPKS